MSEQPQQGAGYPQPTSGQPAQGYQQQPYASPQAQYQQQAYGYAPSGPSFFDKLGVPSLPAILAISGLGGYVLAYLVAGLGEDALRNWTYGILGGVQSLSTGLVVLVGLTLFLGPKLRKLWQFLSIAAGALLIGDFLFVLVTDDSVEQMDFETGEMVSVSSDKGDAAAWIGAILLVAAIGCLVAAAVLRGEDETEESKAAKAQQAAAAQAAQQQQMQAYQTGQVGQAGQPQQQPSQPQQPPQPGQPGQQWPQQ